MTPIFTISSRGGSATRWLNNIINSHPEIVCFHGFRQDPFEPETTFQPEKLAKFLMMMRERSSLLTSDYFPSNSFGTIHTYHGTEPRDSFMAEGGNFSVILRDPFCRIHSLFAHHHLRNVRNVVGGPAHRMDYDALRKNDEIGDARNITLNEIHNSERTLTENWFLTLCLQILKADLDAMTNCDPHEILRYEDLVGSKDGLKDGLSRALDTEVSDDFPGIADHFDRPTNSHSTVSLTAEDIFSSWPDKFRKFFFHCFLAVGYDGLEKAYAKNGYTLPLLSQAWLEQEIRHSSAA